MIRLLCQENVVNVGAGSQEVLGAKPEALTTADNHAQVTNLRDEDPLASDYFVSIADAPKDDPLFIPVFLHLAERQVRRKRQPHHEQEEFDDVLGQEREGDDQSGAIQRRVSQIGSRVL